MDTSPAQTRKPYTSDLTEAEWAIIKPFIPVHTSGRPRTTKTRLNYRTHSQRLQKCVFCTNCAVLLK